MFCEALQERLQNSTRFLSFRPLSPRVCFPLLLRSCSSIEGRGLLTITLCTAFAAISWSSLLQPSLKEFSCLLNSNKSLLAALSIIRILVWVQEQHQLAVCTSHCLCIHTLLVSNAKDGIRSCWRCIQNPLHFLSCFGSSCFCCFAAWFGRKLFRSSILQVLFVVIIVDVVILFPLIDTALQSASITRRQSSHHRYAILLKLVICVPSPRLRQWTNLRSNRRRKSRWSGLSQLGLAARTSTYSFAACKTPLARLCIVERSEHGSVIALSNILWIFRARQFSVVSSH
mmetsp:Transcript_35370/g.82704  ORF Transcript_35370/g.82704 Transcript_35370/m.82704 type:complete len:286 (-) Transcript_35370:145-1002(-)